MRARSVCVLAALAAGAVFAAHVRRERRLYALLRGERAARRLTEGCLHRDVLAFRRRLEGVAAQQAAGAGGASAEARFGFGSDLEGGR